MSQSLYISLERGYAESDASVSMDWCREMGWCREMSWCREMGWCREMDCSGGSRGRQIPLTMSHPSAEGSGGTSDLVPIPLAERHGQASCEFLARLQEVAYTGSLRLLSEQASWICQVA